MGLLVWCVGNALLGDDAVGCKVAELLSAMGVPGVVDCGTTPENYAASLRKNPPAALLIVDAAEMGLPPGQCRKLTLDELSAAADTSHGVPLSLLLAPFKDSVRITALGIQPGTLQVGAPLTPAVERAAIRAANLIASGNLPGT